MFILMPEGSHCHFSPVTISCTMQCDQIHRYICKMHFNAPNTQKTNTQIHLYNALQCTKYTTLHWCQWDCTALHQDVMHRTPANMIHQWNCDTSHCNMCAITELHRKSTYHMRYCPALVERQICTACNTLKRNLVPKMRCIEIYWDALRLSCWRFCFQVHFKPANCVAYLHFIVLFKSDIKCRQGCFLRGRAFCHEEKVTLGVGRIWIAPVCYGAFYLQDTGYKHL